MWISSVYVIIVLKLIKIISMLRQYGYKWGLQKDQVLHATRSVPLNAAILESSKAESMKCGFKGHFTNRLEKFM